MKRHLIPLLLCIAILPALAQYNSYNLPKATAKITIDGRLDEPDWQKPPLISEFHPFNAILSEIPETKVWMVQEEDSLVIAVESMEEFPGAMVARASHDGSVWTDDHIEFFFDTAGDRKSCVQILVNSKGTVADGILRPDAAANWDWECNAELKTAVLTDRWILEMRIPFASFPPMVPGADWPFHITRSRYTMNTMHLTSLKAKLNGFHEMQYFDSLCGIRCEPTGIVVRHQAFNSIAQKESELPFFEGKNTASITLANENNVTKRVNAYVDVTAPDGNVTTTSATLEIPANSTIIANIPWLCTLAHEGSPITVRMEMEGRRLQSFSTAIRGIQPTLGNLRMNAISFSNTTPAVAEFPINLVIAERELTLLWELWSQDGSKMLASGQTALSRNEMKIRIFKSFMKPALYRLRRFIVEEGKTMVSREDIIAITASPWDNINRD